VSSYAAGDFLMIRRREFIAGLGGAAAWPLAARAQQQTKPTIVVLGGRLRPYLEPEIRRGLADVGFLEGDVTIEYRLDGSDASAGTVRGFFERLPAVAADVVRQRPAAIVAPVYPSALAAKAATRDIPIIFLVGLDPVELGLVANLNRPGGNLTGVMWLPIEIAEKRLQLLHEAVPAAGTIALLSGPTEKPSVQIETRHVQSAARNLGLRLLVFNLVAPFQPGREALATEISQVFTTLVEQRVGAVLVSADDEILVFKGPEIRSHAARFALPTMFAYSDSARAGGLLSYGISLSDATRTFRQLGVYTGRILKGEKPGDLPVFLPATQLEFVINLKTAKALGLTIPTNLLVRADEVIEE
jgi:putative tryptophan/tyrosine transport system substrate-binding protein